MKTKEGRKVVKGRPVVTRRNEIYRSSIHPMMIQCQIRIPDNFCEKITSLRRRGIIPRATRIVFNEEREIILERSISGNYLQDEQLGRERKLSGLLSVIEIGRFEEKEEEEEKRMRVR